MVREWYVYVPPFEDIPAGTVLSGYATEAEAREEAERVQREVPKWRGLVLVLPRGDERIKEYARTHPAWAEREGFTGPSYGSPAEVITDDVYIEVDGEIVGKMGWMRIALTNRDRGRLMDGREVVRIKDKWVYRPGGAASRTSGQAGVYPEVREGDIGVLTEGMTADDTAGYSHRIPAGMEVKVVRVEPNLIGFYTGEVIEGENYFVTPLTLEFRRKFRRRTPASWGERAQPPRTCPVCGRTVAGGPDEYLKHIRTEHPEEWRRLETDPTYTLRRAETMIMRCRFCGAPYAYRENLELHERGCPKR
jgi:hypothetical protein